MVRREPLTLELPYPPTVNTYWRRVGNRTVLSRKGRQYRKDVIAICFEKQIKPFAGPIVVDIAVNPPDRRKRDIDNLPKALLDALEHAGVYADDGDIQRLTIEKLYVIKGGKTTVRIRDLHERKTK